MPDIQALCVPTLDEQLAALGLGPEETHARYCAAWASGDAATMRRCEVLGEMRRMLTCGAPEPSTATERA